MANLITSKKYRFEIPDGKTKERIDVFLTSHIENATRSKVQKLIEANLVQVNKEPVKPNYKITPKDLVEVEIPVTPHPEDTEPEDIPLNIIYEDDYLIIVNKPAGMVAHPAYSNYSGTLVNALLHHTKKLSVLNEPTRPGIVHRIDKDTSGLLVVAKDDWTHSRLAEQFSRHNIEREYWAVCWGIFKEKKGVIEKNIARSKSDRKKFSVSENEGKTAVTYYQVLEEYEFASLLKLNLKTGRTHQIRVHLNSINHPVFGDITYGGNKIVYGSSLPKIKQRVDNLLEIMPHQALHAKTLGFVHPYTKQYVKYDSDLPEDFKELLFRLKINPEN
jgi:23S rRNA pseudouridine1911/1915/1917 synthase